MLNKKKQAKLHSIVKDSLPTMPCPECTATDLHAPDEHSIACKNCERVWSMDAFYELTNEAKG